MDSEEDKGMEKEEFNEWIHLVLDLALQSPEYCIFISRKDEFDLSKDILTMSMEGLEDADAIDQFVRTTLLNNK